MSDRNRKAVVSEDGRTISVYHKGREYRVYPGTVSDTWAAESIDTGRLGLGETVWDAIDDVPHGGALA